MKKIKKIAEGSYFVPEYSIPNVQSNVPGTMNYRIASYETGEEKALLPDDNDTLTQEGPQEVYEGTMPTASNPDRQPDESDGKV